MMTVNTKFLVEAIAEASAFKLPDMTDGTEYIYNRLYMPLSRGDELRLSNIDFGSFELEDVDDMRELYANTLEANEDRAEAIARSLWSLPPVTTAAAFI